MIAAALVKQVVTLAVITHAKVQLLLIGNKNNFQLTILFRKCNHLDCVT